MKKMICFMISFFLMMNVTMAVTLTCPEVASPGELITCRVEDNQYIGIKTQYQLENGFLYRDFDMQGSWKSYYDGSHGFSVGNIIDRSPLSFTFRIEVGMDVLTDKDYSINLVNIEATSIDYKYIELDNVNSKVHVVSDINTLDSLNITGGILNPHFDKNVSNYQISVKTDSIDIQAIASDSKARVEGNIGTQKLNYGVNVFSVKVISVRGNIREYFLYVTRVFDKSNSKSSDVTLKNLTLSKGKIDFKKDIFFYETAVDYSIENVEVEAVPNSSKAKVEIQKSDELVVGDNLIKVIVTAEDGTIGNYVILVHRNEKLSNDTSIKSLNVKGYSLNFKSDIYEYELEIEDEDKLDFKIELNDQKAKYNIVGNKTLKNGSVIKVIVTAEDGSQAIYQIFIRKLNESNSRSFVSSIKFIPLIVFILLVIGILLIKGWNLKVVKKNK